MLEKLTSIGKKSPVVPEIDNADHEAEARMFTPSTPSVNIIPQSVLTEYDVSALGTRLITIGSIIVLSFASLFGWGLFQSSTNDSSLADVTNKMLDTQAETSALTGYQTFFNSVEKKRTDLLGVLSTDVRMGDIFREISNAADQNGVTIASMALTVASPGADATATASCPTPDPFGSAGGAGCVTFEGRAGSRAAIDSFVHALNGITGFQNAYVPSSSISDQGSSVSGSVSFSSEFYSQRYDSLGIPLTTAITDGTGGIGDGKTATAPVVPVVPDPTPSATPSEAPVASASPSPTPSATPSNSPTATPTPGGGA